MAAQFKLSCRRDKCRLQPRAGNRGKDACDPVPDISDVTVAEVYVSLSHKGLDRSEGAFGHAIIRVPRPRKCGGLIIGGEGQGRLFLATYRCSCLGVCR